MTSGRPGPSGGEAWRQSRVDNDMSGTVHGDSFQVGKVTGGININNYYGTPLPDAPLSPPPPPPFTPMAAAAAIPFTKPVRPPRRWPRVVGEWLISFAPIFLVSAIPGGVTASIAGDATAAARLASLVIGLAVAGLIGLIWWLVTRHRSHLPLAKFMLAALDRLAFKRLGTSGTAGLVIVIVMFGGAALTGLGQQPKPSTDGGPSAVPFALVFCALVVLVAARRLKR
jgi:hypothetical protein